MSYPLFAGLLGCRSWFEETGRDSKPAISTKNAASTASKSGVDGPSCQDKFFFAASKGGI